MPASIGAGLALLVVAGLGLVVHRPLASVPENTLKFGVGAILPAFGSFWVGEGIDLHWTGADWASLNLTAFYLLVTVALVPQCRQLHRAAWGRAKPAPKTTVVGAHDSGTVGVVLHELWGLFIDDVWPAFGVLVFVAIVWTIQPGASVSLLWVSSFFAGGLSVVLSLSAARRART